jgi:hypothetical protein
LEFEVGAVGDSDAVDGDSSGFAEAYELDVVFAAY